MGNNEVRTIFRHNDMQLEYKNTDNGLWQTAFGCGPASGHSLQNMPYPNFQLTVSGIPYGLMPALTGDYSGLPLEMVMEDVKNTKERIILTYKHRETGLSVEVNMQLIAGANVIRQTTSVKNEGTTPVVITHLSSMFMNGIAADGILPWNDPNKMKVHYCRQTWNGEGQWRADSLEELGLYKCSTHATASAVHFSSIGSWSTGKYLPMAVIEDMETNKVWYFQIEASASWHFEIGCINNEGPSGEAICIHADAADERYGGFHHKLEPGECFTSVPVAVGCCQGGFSDAIRELTTYRRKVLKPNRSWPHGCPIFFNDYMNCLWVDPTRDKLIAKIDAAAKVGAEGFCIDAGWFAPLSGSWGQGLGDWIPSGDRFGEGGLQSILDYIRSKKMIPGVWLEMEVCGEDAILGKKPDSWFLMRNGKRVGGGPRWFLNFNNPEVRVYLHEVIDRLTSMGAGYIKNDYNACIGNGDESQGSSAALGLLNQSRAFYTFIDEVRARHPELILENCGSGGMREDYGILSHFDIQSSSDQEDCYRYPSILAGSLAGILPEQLGIWSYPIPLVYKYKNHIERLKEPAYQMDCQNGERTIFNMVNGLCGNLVLSGNPDAADSLNLSLIKEGVSLYKTERENISKAYPFWPIGFTRIGNINTWASVGLANTGYTRILLAVWRLESDREYMELPIEKWVGKKAFVRQLYPSKGFDTQFFYNETKGSLTVHFPQNNQARYFELTLSE